jgi:DNA-binding transcriptional MerR regulator
VVGRSHLSIGEVLSLLHDEFPDVTISKIRFLESQGLVDPERTPSGYRKFYDTDIERLRWVLRQQRDAFLPLKVIKGRLDNQPEPADEEAAEESVGLFEVHFGGDLPEGEAPAGRGHDTPGAPRPSETGPGAGRKAAEAKEAGAQNVSAGGAGNFVVSTRGPQLFDTGAAGGDYGEPGGPEGRPGLHRRATATDRASERGSTPANAPANGQPAATGARAGASEASPSEASPSEASPSEASPSEAGPSETGPSETGPSETGPSETGPSETGRSGTGRSETGRSGTGRSGTGRSETGRSETGRSETGRSEISPTESGRHAQRRPNGAASAQEERSLGAHRAGGGRGRPKERAGEAGRTAVKGDGDKGDGQELTLEELLEETGANVETVRELEEFALIAPKVIGGSRYYTRDAATITRLASAFARHGVEARHLRAYKGAADREAGLVEQVIMPLIRQRNPEARQAAAQAVEELSTLGGELRAVLLRSALAGLH